MLYFQVLRKFPLSLRMAPWIEEEEVQFGYWEVCGLWLVLADPGWVMDPAQESREVSLTVVAPEGEGQGKLRFPE